VANWFTRLFRSQRHEEPEPEQRAVGFQDVWGSGADIAPLRASSVDTALTLVPVFAATRLLADGVASLPLQTFRQTGDARTRIEDAPLLRDPSQQGTGYDWLHRAMTSLTLRGNAFGYITQFDAEMHARQLEWLHPDEVTVDDNRASSRPRWLWRGRPIDPDRMLHVAGYTLPGQVLGLSPIAAYALTIETGLLSQQFGRDWFRNGSVPSSVLQTEHQVNEDQATVMKERFRRATSSREPVVLGAGVEYKPISVPPNESQFLATMKATVNQIAAIYGIPPEMIGGESGSSMCVDTETEMLTTQGWLRYDEIEPGDTCLTLNTETGSAEWQPVEAVYVFEGPHEVMRLRNGTHSSVTTLGHRWPVLTESRAGLSTTLEWRQSQTLTSADRILSAAPVANLPAEQKWSDALVELVAWFYTEGWVGSYGEVRITQSHTVNAENCARIRAALADVFGPVEAAKHVRSRPAWIEEVRLSGTTQFRLNKRAAACLLAVAPEKVPSMGFLTALTRAQLELFIRVTIDADGSVTNYGTPVLGQKDLRRLEAFQVACALTGRSGVLRRNAYGMWSMAVQTTALRKPKAHSRYMEHICIDGPVWCPTTPNRTWFARREGTTYFTGNTYANVEQQAINFVTYTLRPYLVKLETALSTLLPRPQYVRFNVDGIVRADLKTRYEAHHIALVDGWKSKDEVRALEDLPPLPDGQGAGYAVTAPEPVTVPREWQRELTGEERRHH
jgi:HK97 family phage portal protein